MRRHPYVAGLRHPNHGHGPPANIHRPLRPQNLDALWILGAVLAAGIVTFFGVGLLGIGWVRTSNQAPEGVEAPPATKPPQARPPTRRRPPAKSSPPTPAPSTKRQRPACCGTEQPCPSRLCFGEFEE